MMGYSYYDQQGFASASVWTDNEGDTMKVRCHKSGTVRGTGDDFDFDAANMTEASKQLQEWGYRFVGQE